MLRDTYFPGWKARIDENEVEIIRSDYLFRAVKVPAGLHLIRFEYRPDSFRYGLITSLFCLALLTWMFLTRQPSRAGVSR